MTRFSVIMPLYNKAPYVRKAVESVVGQTYCDWELIVVDDCSTDGSATVVEKIVDPRIRIVRLGVNGGVGAARNRAVVESTAAHICFLDADDWWEPTFLEEMAGLMERHPSAGIYGSGYYIVKSGRKRIAPIGVDGGFTEGGNQLLPSLCANTLHAADLDKRLYAAHSLRRDRRLPDRCQTGRGLPAVATYRADPQNGAS